MSFGGNPPWQRNALGNANQQSAIASLQSQMMNSNFVGFQNMAMAQQAPQNNLSLIPPIGANVGALNSNSGAMFTNQHQSMQFQNARPGLNPNAFSSAQQSQMNSNNNNQSGQNVYKGQNDASFNNNPWNTIQPLSGSGHNINIMQAQMSAQQPQQQSRNYPPFNSMSQSQNSSYSASLERTGNPSRGSNHSSRQSPPRRSSSDRNSSRRDQDEERRRRDKERERERERERDSREKRDDRSPIRRISPKRRARPIPRYNVQIPTNNLTDTEADVLELRRKYNNLYVPSEFFWSAIKWSESFPPHTPFSLQKPCSFHVFHKNVANPNTIGMDIDAELNPSDADSSFSAKVMLMGVPPMKEFYKRCFASAEEKERDKEDLVHPTRLVNFLVGMFGNKEAAPIGGAWSPKLDGENPDKNPSVLIRTAIRTCRAMTGIDLSACTQWYRFVELYYRRAETIRKGRVIPAKTQTVVIFLPDIRSVMPTRIEWDLLNAKYKRHMEMELRKDASGTGGSSKREPKTSTSEQIIDGSVLNVIDEVGDDSNQDEMETETETETDNGNLGKDGDALDLEGKIGKDEATITNQKDDQNSTKPESSNNSDLDVKNMKMNDLRDELDSRRLSSKGLKPQLVARLSKALKAEENEAIANDASTESTADDAGNQNISKGSNEDESNDGMDIDMADIVVIDEYDSTKTDAKHDESSKKDSSKKTDQRHQRWFEWHYKLPENPAIPCHPVQHASLDKFTCEVMSLSVLLDYRPDDKKKHCFEVSLFAELFNEMLMRDFGFNIYKMLYSLPEVDPSADDKLNHKSDDEEPKEKRSRKETESKANTDSKNHKKDGSNNGASNENSKSSKDSKDKEKGSKERRTSRKDDDSDDDARSMRSSDAKKREHKKLTTVNPDLLLSFVYFDHTHCGYIFSHHLEELFYALGLRLSRADTTKIVSKVAPRSLLYRKLTDKSKDEKVEAPVKKSEEEIIKIGKGNNGFLPVFQLNSKIAIPQEHAADENKKLGAESSIDAEENSPEAHMVMHKGALIDVEKLLQQLKRSEKAREETELRLVEVTETNMTLQTSSSKAKDKVKDLQSELKSYNRKLTDAEASLSSTNKKCSEYHSILSGIHDKVNPIFVKSERSKKDPSTRDKDRRDREKEKTNSSSSSKEKDVKLEKSSETKTEVKQEEN